MRDGAGATILSEVVARAGIEAGTLLRRDITLPKRQFYVLRHKERSITCAQQAFLEMLVEPARTSTRKLSRGRL